MQTKILTKKNKIYIVNIFLEKIIVEISNWVI